MMQVSPATLTVLSTALTTATIANAYYHKQQFYPTVVYLTKSNPSLAVLYVQAMVFVLLFGQVMKRLFFGQLRAAESEHLVERGWYAVTETCLAFTVFRDDFSPRFVAQFTLLLFMKAFHWLSEDRVDFMERSPVITIKFHARMMGLVAVLSAVDSYFVSHAYFSTLLKGASSQIVFGFEYAILMSIVFHVAIKYVLHTADLRNAHPWEAKAVYLLYSELVIDVIRCGLYCVFVVVMIRLHTFPLFSIRPFYLTLRALKRAITDVIMSRRAIHAMNTMFPDVTAAELSNGDPVCIICREEMTLTGPQASPAKRLPCAHMFHVACLRSWFQRQQTCPTCRSDILNMSGSPAARAARQLQQQQQNNNNNNNADANAAGGAANNNNNRPAGQQNNNNQNAQQQQQQIPNPFGHMPFMPFMQPPPAAAGASDQPGTSGQQQQQQQWMPPAMMPPGLMLPPVPFPVAPTTVGLSDEEVRQMEGLHRAAVEARIAHLHNMQVLLDCVTLQLQQYTSVLTAIAASPEFRAAPPVIVNPAPPPAAAAAAAPAKEPTPGASSSSSSKPVAPITAGSSSAQAAEAATATPATTTTAAMANGSAASTSASPPTTPPDELRQRRLAFLEKQQQDAAPDLD